MSCGLWPWLGFLLFAPAGAKSSRIPQQIFTYWDTPFIPLSVQVTIDTWQRQNPSWQIHVVSGENLEDFLSSESLSSIRSPEFKDFMSVLGPAHMSDVIRVELLAEKGGVWLDATVAATEGFDKWLAHVDESSACLHMFDLDFQLLEAKSINLRNSSNWRSHFSDGHLLVDSAREPVWIPENWGFATEANCHVVALWRRQLWGLIRHPGGVEGVLQDAPSMHPSYRRWLSHLVTGSYPLWLAIPEASRESYHLLPAEDWAFKHLDYMPAPWLLGPSLPLDYFTDYSGGAMFALARAKEAEPGPPQLGALMKLRRFDRCALNAIVAYRSYAGSSPLAETYALPMEPRWWPPSVGEALAAFEANHCGTSDRFLLFFFASMRMLCSCIFFCNDHPCLMVAICVTSLRLCRFYIQSLARKSISKER